MLFLDQYGTHAEDVHYAERYVKVALFIDCFDFYAFNFFQF